MERCGGGGCGGVSEGGGGADRAQRGQQSVKSGGRMREHWSETAYSSGRKKVRQCERRSWVGGGRAGSASDGHCLRVELRDGGGGVMNGSTLSL